MHIHFIGICGTFMSGLARIATELGHQVTGSDKAFYPPMSQQLEDLGVKTYKGYGSDIWNQISPDLVIVGNVCTRGMPIIEAMLDKKINYISGPMWLNQVALRYKKVVAIAGTHGKTTTTSMLTHILLENNIDAGYLIGGVANNLEHSASLGSSDVFVIEADEYDSAYFDKRPKFIHYNPYVFIIGNIEFDHGDIYRNISEIETQFHYGVRMVPPKGTVVWGDGESVELVKRKGCWSNSIDLKNAPFYLNYDQIKADDQQFSIPHTITGEHNYKNAYRAILAANILGVSISDSIKALQGFLGVKRRLELIYHDLAKNILIYEDFAHHPSAIQYTLKTLKDNYQNKKLIAAFEPRSNTMKMGVFTNQLSQAFQDADQVYALTDHPIDCSLSTLKQFDSIDLLIKQIISCIDTDTVLVLMSNGDFSGIYQKIITQLEQIDHQS